MDRRRFLRTAAAAGLALGARSAAATAGAPRKARELRITRILVQPARGDLLR